MANCYRMFAKSLPFTMPLSTLIWTMNYRSNYLNHFNVIADDKPDNMMEFISNFNKWIYPTKPDRSEMRKFLNFFEMLPTYSNVLIIGSNPELRDIAFINNKNITCCDYNKSKMELMRNNMKYNKYINNENEQLIECNLLNINENEILSKKKYDLIFCIDGHLNKLPFEKWDKFLLQIFDRLKFNGFFILKLMNKPNNEYFHKFTTPETIVDDWLFSEYKNDIGYLFMKLLMYLYANNNENNSINWSDVIDLVNERCDKYKWEWSETQKTEFFDKFGYFKDNNVTFYCNEEDITKELLVSDKFYMQQICYGDDDENKYEFTPIYVLGKQSSKIGGKPFVFGHGNNE
eukprot:250487_1